MFYHAVSVAAVVLFCCCSGSTALEPLSLSVAEPMGRSGGHPLPATAVALLYPRYFRVAVLEVERLRAAVVVMLSSPWKATDQHYCCHVTSFLSRTYVSAGVYQERYPPPLDFVRAKPPHRRRQTARLKA